MAPGIVKGSPADSGLAPAHCPLAGTCLFCTLCTESWEISGGLLEWIGLCLGIVVAGSGGDLCRCAPSRPPSRPGRARPERPVACPRRPASEATTGSAEGTAAGPRRRDSDAPFQRAVLPFVDGPARGVHPRGPLSPGSGCPRSGRAAAWRHRIVVRFLNASGKQDGVAIRLCIRQHWVDAIKTHLITRVLDRGVAVAAASARGSATLGKERKCRAAHSDGS